MANLNINGIEFETRLNDTDFLEMLILTMAENEELTEENIGWLKESCIPKKERIEGLKAEGRELSMEEIAGLYDSGINDEELDHHIQLLENAPWYCLQADPTDLWDNGTYDKDEAYRMLRSSDHYNLIAVISGTECVDEIWKEDLL